MRFAAAALAFVSVVPAWADSTFRMSVVHGPAAAADHGQCDIRLQIESEAKITIRGDQVSVHNVSGHEDRDGAAECNMALPDSDVQRMDVQKLDGSGEIHIAERPSVRNDFAAVLRIVNRAAGPDRYRFRLTWDTAAAGERDRPNAPEGFVWNNATTLKGHGSGESVLNGNAGERLGDVRVDIDLGGKILVSFVPAQKGSHGARRPIVFSGNVMTRQNGKIGANVITGDGRLSGTMELSLDAKNNVTSVRLNATNGQDRLSVEWSRR